MIKILKDPSQIVTVNTNGRNYKRGNELNEVDVLTDHSIIIENDLIKDILPTKSIKNESDCYIIPVKDRTILPGFVECHTHTVFRSEEHTSELQSLRHLV